MADRYLGGIGRRKRAVASVRLNRGSGTVTVNSKPLDQYFGLATWRDRVLAPLVLVGKASAYDISVKVDGGGPAGQVDAVRLGIARALLSENEELKGTLKGAGLLTRDARQKERRKYGLKKARKAPQFSKR